MPDFKKCPFCKGGTGTGHTGGFENQHLIYCLGCGVTMSADSKDAVAEKWDRRAELEKKNYIKRGVQCC